MEPIRDITLDDILERYDALLLDAYGVLVHSTGALPGAVELIRHLNRIGKPYYLVTNDASKLPETAARRYQGFGLAVDAERIISSGALLPHYFAAHDLAGRSCAVLGPGDSVRFVERAGGRVVPPWEPFDVLVVGDESGFPFLETVDAVLSALFAMLDRGADVSLILPNPDLVYPKGGQNFGIAGGSIALILEAALRQRYPGRPVPPFVRLGKPGPALFQEARRRIGPGTLVMIGDQLDTDILGANRFGIDSVLVTGGVTALDVGFTGDTARPTYLLRALVPPPGG